MSTDFLESYLERPDLAALDAWLAAADDTQLRRAATWQRSNKAALAEYRSGEAWEVNRARMSSATLVIASCAPPGEAAKKLPWKEWWFPQDEGRAFLVRALHRRPRAWAEAFVPAAARAKLGRQGVVSTAPFLFALLDALICRHDLPVPDGDAFLEGWALADRPPEDPYLRALLPALLRSPHLRHRRGLPAVLEAKTASGEIARSEVVSAVLEALVVPLPRDAQRVLAELLVRLALTPAELAGRLPLLQNALATGHGSITAVLLPLTVSMATETADIDQIATVIASRSEKRQRVTLLGLLQDGELRERLGLDAILGALAHLDACEDAALRERVARVRQKLTGAPAAEATEPSLAYEGLWAPLVGRRPAAAEPLHSPAGLGHADISDLLGQMWWTDYVAAQGQVNRIGHASLLECLVRGAFTDRDSFRARLRAQHPIWQELQPVPGAIVCWLRGDLEDGPIYDDQIPRHSYNDAVRRWRPREHMINAAAREVLWRAGQVSIVLSTPSLTDGTLRLDTLLHRIESGHVPSYTPYDLAQALLRLRPVSAQDRARLDDMRDLALPADPACWTEHTHNHGRPDAAPQDGVELIRRWVDEGGLRPLDAGWQLINRGGIGWDWGDEPSLPARVLDSLLVDVAALADHSSAPAAVTLAPCWPDLAAVSGAHADILLDGPGPLGTPSHVAVLAPLGGPPDLQWRGVLRLLELAQRESFSAAHVRSALEVLNHAGALPLARLAQGLDQAFGAGGLADLWTVAVDVTADAVQRRPLPSGLPDLLRLLAAYLPAVPDRDLPVELMDFAAARGTTVSHAEARALMAVRDAS